MIMQEGIDQLYNARVVLEHCPPPSVCYTYLSPPNDVTTVGTFGLAAHAATSIIISLSSTELLLVSPSTGWTHAYMITHCYVRYPMLHPHKNGSAIM